MIPELPQHWCTFEDSQSRLPCDSVMMMKDRERIEHHSLRSGGRRSIRRQPADQGKIALSIEVQRGAKKFKHV